MGGFDDDDDDDETKEKVMGKTACLACLDRWDGERWWGQVVDKSKSGPIS